MKKEQNTFEFAKGETIPLSKDLIDNLKNAKSVLNIGNLKNVMIDSYNGVPSFIKFIGDGRGTKADLFNAYFCRMSDINKYTHFLVHNDDYQYWLDFMTTYAEELGHSFVHRRRGNVEYKVSFIQPYWIQFQSCSSSSNIMDDFVSDIQTLSNLKECSNEQDEQIKKMLKKWVCFCLTYEDGKCTNVYTDSGNVVVIRYMDNKMFTNVITETKVNKKTGEKITKEINDFTNNVPKMFAARSKGVFKKEMKYDMILMNPPYDGNLHLKILSQSLNLIKENGICVNLSPIRWLQSLTSSMKEGMFLDGKVQDIIPIPQTTAQEWFNARIFMDLGVYEVHNNQKGKSLSEFDKFKLLGYGEDSDIANKAWTKIQEYAKKDSFKEHLVVVKNNENEKMKDYTVVYSHMSGLMNCHNFVYHNGIAPDGKTYKEHVTNQHKNEQTDHFRFDNFEEADNLRKYIKTPILEWIKKCLSINGWLIMWAIPYFGNVVNPRTKKLGYKSEWTNEDILNVLGISEDDFAVLEKYI